ERRLKLGGGFAVLSAGDSSRRVHDRDARAEAREDLRELQADGTAADDEQRLRHTLQLERRHVVEVVDALDPRHRRHRRARAGCDQHAIAAELALTYTDGVLVEERALARHDL